MQHSANSLTRATLLFRLRTSPNDPCAWTEFVQCYGRKIFAWCRAWGLQDADVQDITQTVLLNLTGHLRNFEYNSSGCFRAWLKTVTHHAWQDYLKKQRRFRPGESADDLLATVESRNDLAKRLADTFDEEVLKEAAVRVRLRIQPHTWDAFYLLAIEGYSGAETARRLGMKVGTVFIARRKVQQMLSDEVARLERK